MPENNILIKTDDKYMYDNLDGIKMKIHECIYVLSTISEKLDYNCDYVVTKNYNESCYMVTTYNMSSHTTIKTFDVCQDVVNNISSHICKRYFINQIYHNEYHPSYKFIIPSKI